MGVRPEDQLARLDVVFHHHLVADALPLQHIDAVLPRKVPHLLMDGGGLRVLGRDVVVDDEDDFRRVGDMGVIQFVFIHIDRQVGGAVVTHHPVEGDGVDLPRLDGRYRGGSRDNLFCNGHAHGDSPFLSVIPRPR